MFKKIIKFYDDHLKFINIVILISVLFCLICQYRDNIINPNLTNIDDMRYRCFGFFMNKGYIPYRDIFDHKGIILYFINSIAMRLSITNGIFLFEIITAASVIIILYYISYKIIGKYNLFAMLMILPYYGFGCVAGNCPEFYCVPFSLIYVYLFFKYVFAGKLSKLQYLILGGLFSIVFLIKFNAAFFLGILCLIVLIDGIINKNYKELLKQFIYFTLGLLIISLPCFMYLLFKGAISDFIKDYIAFNLFYANSTSSINSILKNFYHYLSIYSIVTILFLAFYQNIKPYFRYSYIIGVILSILFISFGYGGNHYSQAVSPAYVIPILLFIKYSMDNKKAFTGLLICFTLLVMPYYCWTLRGVAEVVLNKRQGQASDNDGVELYNVLDEYVMRTINKGETAILTDANPKMYIIKDIIPASKYYYFPPTNSDSIFNEYSEDIRRNKPEHIVICTEHREMVDKDIFDNYNLDYQYKNIECYVKK